MPRNQVPRGCGLRMSENCHFMPASDQPTHKHVNNAFNTTILHRGHWDLRICSQRYTHQTPLNSFATAGEVVGFLPASIDVIISERIKRVSTSRAISSAEIHVT